MCRGRARSLAYAASWSIGHAPNPKFFFYEVFEDEAAFEAHQQTPHFKTLIAGEALPKLAKRERVQYAILQ